jgi:hypothetical protein
MATPPIKQVPEGPRAPGLGADIPEHSQLPGTEAWRDGEGDDGEPTENEALSIDPEDDPEAQNDVA